MYAIDACICFVSFHIGCGWRNVNDDIRTYMVHRFKTSGSSARMAPPSTKRRKRAPTGATSTASRRRSTMAATTLTCTASAPASRANGHRCSMRCSHPRRLRRQCRCRRVININHIDSSSQAQNQRQQQQTMRSPRSICSEPSLVSFYSFVFDSFSSVFFGQNLPGNSRLNHSHSIFKKIHIGFNLAFTRIDRTPER